MRGVSRSRRESQDPNAGSSSTEVDCRVQTQRAPRLRVEIQPVIVRFLTAEEACIVAFMSVSAPSPYQDRLREYAESLLRERFTRPGWCVLALDSDVPVARAAFWATPDTAVPTDLVLI